MKSPIAVGQGPLMASPGVSSLAPVSDVDGDSAWAMVESSPDGMLLSDEYGVISLVNAQISSLFGYERWELLGSTIEMLLPERHRQVHTANPTSRRAEPHAWTMGSGLELIGRRRNGSEFPIEVSLSPLTTNTGVRVVTTVRDITERVDTEAKSHAVLGMIEAAHDGVFMFAPDTLAFTYVNHGAQAQLGYDCGELLSMSLLHIEPEFTNPSFHQLLEPLLTGEVDSDSFTTMLRHKDGIDVPVEIIVDYPPPAGPGKPRLVIALVREITERLEMEEALRCSEASLRRLDDRERLARDLHDLVIQRLFAAGMGLQAIHSSIEDPRAAQRIVDTVTELDLTIGELRTAIFHLSSITSESVAARIRAIAEHAGVQLGFVPTITIDGDPGGISAQLCEQLLPALTEALSNVVRHAQATRVDITLTIDDERIDLAITDDGVGIDPDVPRGNGLDNLITRARSHAGNVTIDSEAHNGTTLVWTTPR